MALIECKECKQKISDSAKECPSCGKKVPKKISIIQWIGIGFLGLVVIAALSGKDANKPQTTAENTAQETVADIRIDQLLSAYKENEVNADNQYKGKLVRVSGITNDIKKDITNSLYVTIGRGAQFELPVVQAFFSEENSGKLAQLKKGQRITVVCRISGLMMNVLAKDCILE